MKKRDHSKRVVISTFPNIRVLVYPSTEFRGWWIVKPMIQTKCSVSGKWDSFALTHRIKHRGPPSRERLARWVRSALRSLLLHELDEGLMVDGKRARDPHKKKQRTRA